MGWEAFEHPEVFHAHCLARRSKQPEVNTNMPPANPEVSLSRGVGREAVQHPQVFQAQGMGSKAVEATTGVPSPRWGRCGGKPNRGDSLKIALRRN